MIDGATARPRDNAGGESVLALPGIGPKRAAVLANLGIQTVRDLLLHLPRAWQDRRHIRVIASLKKGETATIEAEVTGARLVRLRGRMSIAVIDLRDPTGSAKATFFGRGFLVKSFTTGARGIFTGVVGEYKGVSLKNPEYEMLSGDDEDRIHTGRIVPVYRLTEGITQRMLRRWIFDALHDPELHWADALPDWLVRDKQFPSAAAAIRDVHFPDSLDAAQAAQRRFIYEELLDIQLAVLRERSERAAEDKGFAHTTTGPLLTALRSSLPFTITAGQHRAITDVLDDMAAPRPMCRLLQGDVGCGKTLVALHAIASAADGGFQSAILAPTEVLAEQLHRTVRDRLGPLGLTVESLTRSTNRARDAKARIASGETRAVIGTHALIQESVSFHRLGLVVVDEQHRFGVFERSALAAKGLRPDMLQMSATPIPRTLTLTVYGAMDITVIHDLPPGRLPVKTRRVTKHKIGDLYQYVCEQASQGFQTYIVCPLVEESGSRALKAVTKHFDELSAGPLAGVRTALLHGRMAGEEKECVLARFKRGELDVLFTTSVIEVGIDVPTATIMIIEDAPQFGLTQLHQLRGRVGRGPHQAWCFLLGDPVTGDGQRRVDAMCSYSSGFDIAEIDLELRGPGEIFGARQSGSSGLRAADLVRDARVIDEARRDALRLLEQGECSLRRRTAIHT